MKYRDIITACYVSEHSNAMLEMDIKNISIDTRTLEPGDVYVAILGEEKDGHDYVKTAKEKGAVAAIVSRPVLCDIPQIIVKDTTIALGDIARYWRQKFSIPIIAITGSVGKTTVKNMISKILIEKFGENHVLVPERNFNNHWGLPLVLCRLNSQHKVAVLEMGMNHLEEIRYLMKIANPTVGVVTNAGTNHIGLVGSLENIAKAKGEMFEELSEMASAVINADDKFSDYWGSLLKNQKTISFGLSAATITAKNICDDRFALVTPVGEIDVERKLLGEHNIKNSLAATAAVFAIGMQELVVIKNGLEQVKPEPGRLQTVMSLQGVVVLNDTYNGGETSTLAALQVLMDYKSASRKIAVVGDMSELEQYAFPMHQAMGKHVARFSLDVFIAFGPLMKHAYDVYPRENKQHFLTHDEVIKYLRSILQKGDVVLLKGARVMKMEKIFQALTE